MERPSSSSSERGKEIRQIITETLDRNLRKLGYNAADLKNRNDMTASLASRETIEELERMGIAVDSLDVVEALLSLEDDDDEGEGELSVQEPLRPLPNTDSEAASVDPNADF